MQATAATAPDIGTAEYKITESVSLASFATGSGINGASYVWSDTRTLAASATETLTIDAPAARDALGQTLALTKIKAIYIRNKGGASVSASDILKVGGEGSADAWNSLFDGSDTAKTTVEPNGFLIRVAPSANGYAVANPGNFKLKMENTNGAQAITYDIVLIGA